MAAAKLALAAGAALAGAAAWWRRSPSPCPYSQRFWLEAPRPFITRERLRAALAPHPGERLLEVGPGTGYYALPIARQLEPGGRLELLDVQRRMLEHTQRRARELGVANIGATLGDARALPFEADGFDGAYLVTVLGEVPDRDAALRELGRVVRPGGRIVVGELMGDPHYVGRASLRRRAGACGLRVESTRGGPLWHFTRLAPA